MAQIRRAETTWNGPLATGGGTASAMTSMAFTELPVSWGSRTESADGRTSPEELLASAHASCYSMSLSGKLGRNGTPPTKLVVGAAVTFDKLDRWTIVSSALTVHGWVEGIDAETFARIAEGTRDNCPVSRALKGNVELTVMATLET